MNQSIRKPLRLLFLMLSLLLINSSQAKVMDINAVNRSWGQSKAAVKKGQAQGYSLIFEDENSLVFSAIAEKSTKILISYRFNSNGLLCASGMSLPESDYTRKFVDEYFSNYNSEMAIVENLELKRDGREIITIDNSTAPNGQIVITVGFSYYEPMEERDDCVDLGLSVQWATCNLRASAPEKAGSFYAWSETSPKSEYWRENYSFCNNNANTYIFKYSNPLTNICGTEYDAATKRLGDGWRMPSVQEATELITKCTWEKTTVNGKNVFKITGPNGNSIILPIVGWKKQDKDYGSLLMLATGECSSKSSEDCYILSTKKSNGDWKGIIDSQWKAWGYNIRPVYTK